MRPFYKYVILFMEVIVMNYLYKLKEKYSFDQLMIILTCFSLTFPFYICGPILIIEFIYLLYTKKAIHAFKNTPKVKYLFIFLGLSAIISLIYQNWVGIATVAGLFLAFTLMVYYRHYITVEVFEFVLDMLIILSILWAIYGLYEQMQILHRLGVDHFSLKIYSRRENRLNSVFFNANYYAMMIEFIILCIVYKFFSNKNNIKKSIVYVIVGLINLFMLYMTGCRTALIAIAGAILIFLIINKNYKICSVIGIGVLAMFGFFIFHPEKFPRIERLISNFDVRLKIWKCAIVGIKHHPLFGQGPFTYVLIRDVYHGHMTQHAHSVYLDPLLSFGIIGLATIVPYIVDNCQRLWMVLKKGYNRGYVALVISCIVVILLHGIFDYTIMWLHTGLFFLFIASSFSMYQETK